MVFHCQSMVKDHSLSNSTDFVMDRVKKNTEMYLKCTLIKKLGLILRHVMTFRMRQT